MEKKIVTAIIIFFLFINIFPFLVGLSKTPPGKIFLGTVHYPPDYLYYLSHITQSREQFILTEYLTTTEPMPKLFLGWTYVLLGKLGNVINTPPWFTYQFGLLLFGLCYLISAYLLIAILLPNSPKTRILGFLFFMFSNTMPRLLTESGNIILAPYFSWYNYGEPFLRFDSVPHHQLINASIFMILIAFFKFHQVNKIKKIFIAIASFTAAVCLGSMQPVQWILLSATLALSTIVFDKDQIKKRVRKRLPLLIFILGGFPFLLYLQFVISSLKPYTIASAWEAAQSFTFNWDQYFRYFGPIFLIGLLGLPFFIKTKISPRKTILLITCVSFGLFASPFAKSIPILNFRYLSPLVVLFFATSTVLVIQKFSLLFRSLKPLVQSVLILLLFASLLPLFYYHLQARISFPLNEETVYLSEETYALFKKARSISTLNDVFLIYWPYEVIFPAISGRREYFTTKLLTLDYDRKSGEAYQFLTNKMTIDEKKEFLSKNRISYIIAHASDNIAHNLLLQPVESTNQLTLFKVNLTP
jgi:hypothetical protein